MIAVLALTTSRRTCIGHVRTSKRVVRFHTTQWADTCIMTTLGCTHLPFFVEGGLVVYLLGMYNYRNVRKKRFC